MNTATHEYREARDACFACDRHAPTGWTRGRTSSMECAKCEAETRAPRIEATSTRPVWEREGDCCALAVEHRCVCIRSTSCPVHGIRCRGSHE